MPRIPAARAENIGGARAAHLLRSGRVELAHELQHDGNEDELSRLAMRFSDVSHDLVFSNRKSKKNVSGWCPIPRAGVF